MHKTSIFYYHSLDLTFKSAQTLQVVKDAYFLSRLNIEVMLFGVYQDQKDLDSILRYIEDSDVVLIFAKNNHLGKLAVKVKLLLLLLLNRKKIVITRHYRKLSGLMFLKRFLGGYKVVHEMHEESIPHLFKKNISKERTKKLLLHPNLNCVVFTNDSQLTLFRQEFGVLPSFYQVIPNGVEIEKFANVQMSNNFVLTYVGQFNQWKNIDLVFAALSLLPEKYSLKIAGGKGDKKSQNLIASLISKYCLDPVRVNYLGFVDNALIPEKVLNNSNILLLPLGDNMQSQYLTSPMKLFEYMSTQIPILAIDYPSVRSIAGNSVFFSSNNPNDFADQVRKICHKSEFDFSSMNRIARQYSYQNRSQTFARDVINMI